MAEQMRPENRKKAPDPSNSYERAHPENEAGMGRLDNNDSTPTDRPDQVEEAVDNRQESHQLNSEDVVDQRENLSPEPRQHSMHEEAPQTPPRQQGKGGTP
jgi:hypothetical protein